MFGWLKSFFKKQPEPVGPPKLIRAFSTSSQPITQDGVSVDQNGWRIDSRDKRTVRLFEVPQPGIELCMVTYRARMKTANVQGGTYLEMWCRFPRQGEFFSKGLHHSVKGTTDWASCETPFYLMKGQIPDLIKLNLVCEGAGTVWIKEVELLQTPLE
ncbi:MAG: hypothetical protein ACREQA_18900 [Candidatus Binatia bacterium]